jgi:hypothetical protein
VLVSFIDGENQSTLRNHQAATSHGQTLLHNVVSGTPSHEWESDLQL